MPKPSRVPPPELVLQHARPMRPRPPAKKRARKSGSSDSELSLIWGLVYDLVRAPGFLILLLLGRADPQAGLLPLRRIVRFVLSAKATATLISLNLMCFAVELYAQRAWPSERFWAQFAFSPQSLWQGQLLPAVLHIFSHASLPHLFSNMLALFVFGRVVEGLLGPWRLLGAYFTAAVAATLASLFAQGLAGQYVPTLGASGAVAGLIALGVLLAPLTITFEALIPMPLFLVGWIAMAGDVLALWAKTKDSVDHPAHLGGYLSVVLVYRLLPHKLKVQARFGLLLNILTVLFALLLWYLRTPQRL